MDANNAKGQQGHAPAPVHRTPRRAATRESNPTTPARNSASDLEAEEEMITPEAATARVRLDQVLSAESVKSPLEVRPRVSGACSRVWLAACVQCGPVSVLRAHVCVVLLRSLCTCVGVTLRLVHFHCRFSLKPQGIGWLSSWLGLARCCKTWGFTPQKRRLATVVPLPVTAAKATCRAQASTLPGGFARGPLSFARSVSLSLLLFFRAAFFTSRCFRCVRTCVGVRRSVSATRQRRPARSAAPKYHGRLYR